MVEVRLQQGSPEFQVRALSTKAQSLPTPGPGADAHSTSVLQVGWRETGTTQSPEPGRWKLGRDRGGHPSHSQPPP